MRKYNNKMKKTMIIIGILFVVIVIIFSLFLKKAIDIDKTFYEIDSGAILFDNEQNKIVTSNSGIIKVRWGGDYYLTYNDDYYKLGSHSVIYDASSGDINLYGKYYEVLKNGEVEVIEGENIIKSSVNSKFYKLADRKYLIIDRVIESSDSSFVTSNYLMIHLDKLGNATLLNDKTSYKTIQPTILKTSSFAFDIANEKINFGDDNIDLKKIIGSTNEYDPDKYDLNAGNEEDSEGTGDGTGTGTGTGSGSGSGSGTGSGDGSGGSGGAGGAGGDGTGEGGAGGGASGSGGSGGAGGSGGSGGSGGDGTGEDGIGGGGSGSGGLGTNSNGTTSGNESNLPNNNRPGVSDGTIQEIINAARNTSVIRVTGGISTIEVDYVVYDPLNEYMSVYVEIENSTNSQINTVYLSKTDTNIVFRDLSPNVFYNLKFKYTYYDENGYLKEYTFDEVGLFTEVPKMVMNVTKIANNKLYYKVILDNSYTITGGTVNLYLNGQFTGISGSINSMGNVSQISGNDCYVDLSTLNLNKNNKDILELRLVSISFNTYTISPGVYYKFMY